MAGCLPPCGCEDKDALRELDRYTDKIENILADQKGRSFFKQFMESNGLKDGVKALKFYNHCDKLARYEEDYLSESFPNYLAKVEALYEESERIDELDSDTRDRLAEALDCDDSQKKELVASALIKMREDAAKTMRREYQAFRENYVRKK